MTIAITNIEQTTDELHGFGLLDYNINIVVDPGETKTVTFKATKRGVPYYCTNFCSALHQEMQGYLIVKSKKSFVGLRLGRPCSTSPGTFIERVGWPDACAPPGFPGSPPFCSASP